MAANESTKYTHFSNVEIGTANGGGGFKVAGVQQNLGTVQTVTDAITLTAADNGKTFILGDAAPGNITLPAVTNAGFHCKVITGFAITSASALVSAEGDNMEGSMIVAGAVVDVNAADQINFVQTAENIGDFVEVISDGTYWHVFGNALTTGALTATG